MRMTRCHLVASALLLASLATAAPAAAQDTRYTFLGAYRGMERLPGGVTVRAENGAVRVEQIAGTGFRFRYSASSTFDTASSYATIPESLTVAAPAVRETADAITLRGQDLVVTVRKRPVRVTVADTAGHELFAESFGYGRQGERVAHIVARPPEAHYFGLGEQAARLDRSGGRFELWNTDAPGYGPGDGPLYSSFPFYIALRRGAAYGLFYDDSFRSAFDFGAALKEHAGFFADGGELRYFVFAGPAIADVLRRYSRITGRMPLPPRWALGYQQSRWGYYPDSELIRVADEFRARGFPGDVLYSDLDWMDGNRLFTFSPQRFPDPARMTADLRARGFKLVVIVDIAVKVDSGYDVYRDGLAKGVFATWPDGTPYVGQVWPGRTTFPDFSNPTARRWWGDLHRRLFDAGVAGFWNDMNEPSNFGGRTLPEIVQFDADGRGASASEIHNVYALLEARATYEGSRRLQPEHRPFMVTRAAFSGSQRYTSIWTGDNTANWDHAGLAVQMVLGLNLAGMPFAGADIGGFIGAPDAELFSRFLEVATFFPFERTHEEFGAPRREPWVFGPVYEAANREMIRLRYRLLPHLYTAFFQHARDGRPVDRPLVFAYQTDSTSWGVDDEFLFGDHLLVAPVVRQGQDQREVYLPAGTWYRFHSDERYAGGRRVTVSAPRVDGWARDDSVFVRGVPLFVEAGSVLPMGPVLRYVGERAVDTLDLHVYDGGSATSELYEDAGDGYGYTRGESRLTTFTTESSADALAIAASAAGRWAGAASVFRVVVHGLATAPRSVTVDGAAASPAFDARTRVLTFVVDAGLRAIRIVR
jgi:alpha-glucosidase